MADTNGQLRSNCLLWPTPQASNWRERAVDERDTEDEKVTRGPLAAPEPCGVGHNRQLNRASGLRFWP